MGRGMGQRSQGPFLRRATLRLALRLSSHCDFGHVEEHFFGLMVIPGITGLELTCDSRPQFTDSKI